MIFIVRVGDALRMNMKPVSVRTSVVMVCVLLRPHSVLLAQA